MLWTFHIIVKISHLDTAGFNWNNATFNPGLDDNKSNLCFTFQSRDRYVTKKITVVM